MKTNKTRTIGNKVSRLVGLFLVFGVLLGVSSSDVFAQVPPANTQIGNQASATYVDNGGNTQSITSNTVQTIVQQVAGVDINNGITLTVSPGGQVTFPHTITNTGNGVDFFNLTAIEGSGDFNFEPGSIVIYPDANEDGVPDNFTPITFTPNIDPPGSPNGNTYGIVIVADVPISAGEGDSETITVTATSNEDSNVSDNATNTTNVDEDAVINVQKNRDKQFVAVGDTVTYTFTYSEQGGSSNAANLVIRDPLPAGVTYVEDSGVWSGAAGIPLTDSDAGETATGITYKRTATSPDSVVIEIASINAGASGTVSFKVTVDAGTEGNTIINSGTFSHDDAPTPVSTNNASIQVDENYIINRVGADTVLVNSAEQGSIVNFLNLFENVGTATDTYNITLSGSNYPAGTTFTFFKVDGSNNPTSPYTDTNNDGIADTGPIAVGDTAKVVLQVNLPSGESGGPYAVVKTLTSINDPSANATHTDALGEITTPTVDLTNNAEIGGVGVTGVGEGPEASPVTTIPANPGTTVNFTLFVNNTSSIDDEYQLAFATDTTSGGELQNVGSLPTGWTASFRDPNNGDAVLTSVDVTAGNFREITLRINIPAGFAPGDVDIFARVLSQTTGAKDIKFERVSVSTIRSMSLVAGQSAQVSPGGSVDYIHTLTINSNVDENVGGGGTESDLQVFLDNSVPTGWTARVYWDTNDDGQVTAADSLLTSAASTAIVDLPSTVGSLQFGDQLKFIVQVTASTGLDDGATVTTTLEISDSNPTPQLATVSNDDQTEVQAGRLSIDKFQAPAVNGSAGTFTKSDFNVLPGDTVYYQITIVNDGSEPVTSVVVNDAIPSFTTVLEIGAFNVDIGTVPGVTLSSNPAVGQTGTITLDIPQLDPTEQVTLTFAVKVDS